MEVPRAMPGRWPQPRDEPRRLAGYLTCRERDCLGFLVDGLDTSAMAAKLGVAVRTHVQSVLTKLGVHSRLEAASLAVRHELLGPERTGSAPEVW